MRSSKIGEDVTETVERRPASIVVVRTHKPKFVPKDRNQIEERGGAAGLAARAADRARPCRSGVSGRLHCSLAAGKITCRFIGSKEFTDARVWSLRAPPFAAGTLRLAQLAKAAHRLDVEAIALSAPYLCTDATGVLVQDLEKCRNAHFFVVAAPQKHVLFGYTPQTQFGRHRRAHRQLQRLPRRRRARRSTITSLPAATLSRSRAGLMPGDICLSRSARTPSARGMRYAFDSGTLCHRAQIQKRNAHRDSCSKREGPNRNSWSMASLLGAKRKPRSFSM